MFVAMTKAAARTARRAKSLLLSPAARRHALVGQERLWKMKRDFQAKFLIGHGLSPSDYLLDVGCGTLRGGIPLIRYLDTGHYYGIEVRAEVLDEALRELEESGLRHKQPILVSDPGTLDLRGRFTFAWAFSVLFHLRDEILDDTLELVANSLDEGRRVLRERKYWRGSGGALGGLSGRSSTARLLPIGLFTQSAAITQAWNLGRTGTPLWGPLS